MLDCTRRHLKTNKLKTALFKLLQGGPFTDSPGVMEPVWRGTQSLTVHHEMHRLTCRIPHGRQRDHGG